MSGFRDRTYYTARGSILYSPSDPIIEKCSPAQLPEPPFRRRQPRPSSIHIIRYPAGYIWCPAPDTPPPKKPSRLKIKIQKLASRENAKRVLGSVFSSFSSPFSASSPAAEITESEARRIRHSVDVRSGPLVRTEIRPRPHSIAFPPSQSTTDSAISSEMNTNSAARSLQSLPGGRGSISLGSSLQGAIPGSPSVRPANAIHTHEPEKPLASSGGISMLVQLAEPHVYLTGFDHDGRSHSSTQNSTAMIRGKLVLNITKPVKIKAVTLSFCGKARTEWPEGIPPVKSEYFEEIKMRNQVLPFFNAAFENSDSGYGVQCKYTLKSGLNSDSQTNLSVGNVPTSGRSSRSSTLLSTKEQKRLSLQTNQSKSFSKYDTASQLGNSTAQKGYKTFQPGVYEYSFELELNHTSPETIDLPLGSVRWMLDALVERSGTFKANVHGTKEVLVIRAPDQNSLEQVEPIAISRKWEDQLHYDIVISGKSFPIGGKIPIAFKLTPLAKVQCHRIKVYVTENADYFTNDKKVTRRDAQRKILLFERQAGKPLSDQYKNSEIRFKRGGEQSGESRDRNRARAQQRRDREARSRGTAPEPLADPAANLLGDLDLGLDDLAVSTEIEMDVQLPTCAQMRKDRTKMIHPDSTWKLIQVHHWIKIVMRLSRLDTDDPSGTKRRHFEISIDSPFHILSCLATQHHTSLPEYSSATLPSENQRTFECGCPNAAPTGRSSASSSSGNVPTLDSLGLNGPDGAALDAAAGLAMPQQAHLSEHGSGSVQRPMHLLRAPSFNPPPFEAEEPPPPLPTPPPGYDIVIGTPSHDGLADYFARLADAYSDEDNSDEDVIRGMGRNGRVNVVNPRTPGGGRRVNRSMDVSRDFMFRPEGFDSRLQEARREGQTAT